MGLIRDLFIPRKTNGKAPQPDYGTDMRAIESWANELNARVGGGIEQITSTDGTVTVTNPTGPVVDLHVTTGGGGGIASISGSGITSPTGDLTQAGNFTVGKNVTIDGGILTFGGAPQQITSLGGSGTTLQVQMSVQAIGNGPDALISSGYSFIRLVGNAGSSATGDSGTISFGGAGPGLVTRVQFVFVSTIPTFLVNNATFAFLAQAAGHIYYNPGGGTTWTLLI